MNARSLPADFPARSVYERMIEVFFNFRPVEDLHGTIHENFRGYGTAAHGVFGSMEDVMGMARMQAEQLRAQEFSLKRMPVSAELLSDGATCLIVEEFEIYMHENQHLLALRLTTILEQMDGKWLVTHFHGSTPDSDIAEDEAFPVEGLRKKNVELEAKIQARTRELEIETSLERTRARSMQMQQSHELHDISKIFHEQLLTLGIDSEFSFVWLPNEGEANHLFWTTWMEESDNGAEFHTHAITYPLDKSEPYTAACFDDWESDISVHEHFVEPKDIDTFFASWEELLDGASNLNASNFPDGIYYTEAFMKYGCFGIDIRRSLTDEEKSILHRFAIEFERTYTRFLDLQKAESQAKEAEIELALERVRASAMAMHSSDDLSNVASVLFEQMKNLGGDLFAFGIILCDKYDDMVEQWHSLGDQGMLSPFLVPVHLDHIHQFRYDQWKAGKELFSIEIPEHYINRHFELMFELPAVKRAMEEVAEKGAEVEVPKWEIDYGASFRHGYLLVSSLTHFKEDYIFPRFANVFEQAYTRFLDLQKAEAQAKKAQVEASLERVRSRSMGMQKSEELKDVVRVIFDQLKLLDINAEHAGIVVDYVPKQDWHFWVAETQDIPARITVPYLDLIWDRQYVETKEKGEELFTTQLGFEEKNRFYNELLDYIPGLTQEARDFYLNCPGLAASTVIQEDIGLYIENFSGTPYSDQENSILMRFGKVFQQSYTRFLDLKRAEAQAREADIQLSMERVRARALGMHSTDELNEVLCVLLEQFDRLDINPVLTHLTLFDEENQRFTLRITTSPANNVIAEQEIDVYAIDSWKNSFETWKNGSPGTVDCIDYPSDVLPQVWEVLHEVMDALPDEYKIHPSDFPQGLYTTQGYCKYGYLGMNHDRPASEEEKDIVARFAAEFGGIYQRFLDLQKAEAQAREAQIETALEKVRSRSMGMRQSDELEEVIQLVYDQFIHLGVQINHTGFILDYQSMDEMYIWLVDQNDVTNEIVLPYFESAHWNSYLKVKADGGGFFTNQLNAEETAKYFRDMFEYIDNVPEEIIEFYVTRPGVAISTVLLESVGLYIENYSGIPFTEAENEIVRRFGKVFQQTYTRFKDLQKAEAQAREAQIEAALERVRSRTMAMKHSDELAEASFLLDKEVRDLGIKTWGCAFNIHRENDSIEWFGNEAGLLPTYTIPRVGIFNEYYEKGQAGESIVVKEFAGEECIAHYEYMSTLPILGDVLRQLKETNGSFPDYQIDHVIYFKYGYLLFITREHVPDAYDIFKRFAQVFEQTYTRFLDLQKAEEQAREAQIELALERIRAHVTAMQESSDLLDIVVVMRSEFVKLGHEAHYFWHMRWLPDIYQKAMTSGDGTRIGMVMELPRHIHGDIPLVAEWEKGNKPTVVFPMDAEEAVDYVDKMVRLGDFEQIDPQAPGPDDIRHIGGLTFVMARTTHGEIGFSLPGPVPDPPQEALETLVRFAGVFDLAYKRFEDLKQSEKRKKEAEIELGLEKLRSRTMAMQHSDEIPEVANLLFLEIQRLGIPAWSCGFNILAEDKTSSVCLMSSEGTLQKPFDLPFTGEASFLEWHDFVRGNADFFVQELKGEAIEKHYDYMKSLPQLTPVFEDIQDAGLSLPTYQINHLCKFTHGFLLFITYEQVNDAHDIFKRFTSVFEQTYTRFLDLKNMESQTREAKIETALERVRARALAMQEPEELKEVAEVMRKEMGLLGVEELETSSIYINDEEVQKAECWFAIKDLREDKKVMVTDQFSLDLTETWVGREMLKFYRSHDDQVSIVMKGEARKEWIFYCEDRAAHLRGYYGEVIPERTYHLYKFSHGSIGVATPGALSEESWGLLKRAASAFSLAYSRFKDLTKARVDLQRLKEEKKRAEEALNELKLTQDQLVHAEKMASLGELTAGIAHEIKNPLNFINNFSDVTRELVEEMIQELKNGDADEADSIAKDVIQNLEKIVHHGQRADSIVRGMLQHSRSGNGQKEPTDLNALADEYLRLAYHGLRAKDKSFNAKMETDYDSSAGKLNVVPQDIGRVLLNLLTNAFHAVTERKQNEPEGYEPTIWVGTRITDTGMELTVRDNGNGIPAAIRDKIFQPFFTTKPTGQGTGLGLSMSYDIVTKGHGGQINISSDNGNGTTFTIVLPNTQS